MHNERVVPSPNIRWYGLAAAVGGGLWVPYGIFEMLEPWGTDAIYRDDLGYSLVTDALLFVMYSLPGSLALLLSALGLLGILFRLGLPAGSAGRIGRFLAHVALALSILSVLGVLARVDPLFTSTRVFGSLALGVATFLVGLDARGAGTHSGWTPALLALGLLGILLLPLWPLVYAAAWVSEYVGAAYIALFGLGWLCAGYALSSTREPR